MAEGAVDAAIKSGKLNPKNNYLTSNIHRVGGDGWNPAYFIVRVGTDKRYWLKWYASKWYGSKGLASKRLASKPVSARNLIILHGSNKEMKVAKKRTGSRLVVTEIQ